MYKFKLNHGKLLIGLCPGVGTKFIKIWPHYYYVTLTINLIYEGYHVVILGSLRDRWISKYFECNVLLTYLKEYFHNFLGCTSLRECIVIIAACQGIISNDSGLMHITCALNKPVVSLYGPSSPSCTPPLSHKSIVMYRGNGYDAIESGRNNTYGYHNSLIAIKPNQVLNALKILLRGC